MREPLGLIEDFASFHFGTGSPSALKPHQSKAFFAFSPEEKDQTFI
jgi:coproporphyrinogen III oxidase-like Fe-S oxidoreductase